MVRFSWLAFLIVAFLCCLQAGTQAAPPDRGVAAVRGSSPKVDSASEELTDALSNAADCLSRGDDAGAANYLARHVASNPEQIVFRAQLADVLARLDRLADAQSHYETAIAHAQNGSKAARDRLVNFHTRLMEIARQRNNSYSEHLHRGIGLYLVAIRLADSGKTDDVERLLFKAADALKEAQIRRPDDARPAWYLYQVWSKLDQPRPAEKSLQKALAAASLSDLSPAESRELFLAGRLDQKRK